MTAETATNEAASSNPENDGAAVTGSYVLAGVLLFIIGLVVTGLAAIQLVLPDLLSGNAYTTYGRLAPAGRILLWQGWLPLGGLGLSLYVVCQITGGSLKRRGVATVGLVTITVGALASAGAVIAGLSTGVSGLESPVWARGISAIGFLLAAAAITATARQKADHLGAAGWYLTAGSWWLAASAIFGLFPLMAGTAGSIQSAFTSAGLHRLFAVTVAVGLLYFAFSRVGGTDLSSPRPLAALGFWSLTFTWAFTGGIGLIYSATPDWYETLTVAFAIGTLVAVLAIVTDLGLLLKGRVTEISDRATLRYGIVGGFALVGATIVNLLLAWRASSGVVQFSTWLIGLDLLLILGGVSFAIFAANSVRNGGRASGTSFHFSWSVIGLAGAAVALLSGGIVTGFSWIASPSSQLFSNFGPGYEIAVVSLVPFLWTAAISLGLYLVAQIVYLVRSRSVADEPLTSPEGPSTYDLEFEGATRYLTWRRLVWGSAAVWIAAALFTAVVPVMDKIDTAPTIIADNSRNYPIGSLERAGRDLYISEGCAECHTQSVRPIVADVGLGPVSIAGDYAYEDPALITGIRFGPDLMHVAARDDFSPDALASRLRDPRSARAWSIMPSYSYLSDADIEAIVSYIQTLR